MLSEGEHICPVCGLVVEGLEAYEEHMGKRHVPGTRWSELKHKGSDDLRESMQKGVNS
jgi:rubredoxin